MDAWRVQGPAWPGHCSVCAMTGRLPGGNRSEQGWALRTVLREAKRINCGTKLNPPWVRFVDLTCFCAPPSLKAGQALPSVCPEGRKAPLGGWVWPEAAASPLHSTGAQLSLRLRGDPGAASSSSAGKRVATPGRSGKPGQWSFWGGRTAG